jgi:hypothetical protein
MSQYLLSMYYPQGAGAAVPDDLPAIMARVEAYNQELADAGAWVSTAGLEFAAQARVVTAGEPPLVSDGPYLDSKEHLGGFWIIEAADADAATAWAAKASAAVGLPIEVRAVQG